MPQLLPPEAARFEVRDGTPVLTLAVDAPTSLAGDWQVLSRLTLVVIDGPGDDGFLLPRLTPNGDAPPGWDDAIARAGGAHIRFGASFDAPALFARAIA